MWKKTQNQLIIFTEREQQKKQQQNNVNVAQIYITHHSCIRFNRSRIKKRNQNPNLE